MRKAGPATMEFQDLAAMESDDLWRLYEELAKILADKITAERRELEQRLAKLHPVEIVRDVRSSPPLSASSTDRPLRRKYPKVLPKYGNPLVPSQKWSGRGKTPRWVIAALAAGHKLDELKIEHAQQHNREQRSGSGRTVRAVR